MVLRHPSAQPDKCAVVSGRRRLTHAELAAAVDRSARRLSRIGIIPRDRVLVQLPNDPEFLVLVLALIRLGALPVLAIPMLREHELDHVLAVTRPVALAVPARFQRFDHLAMAEGLRDRHPDVRLLLVTGHDRSGHIDLEGLCFEPGGEVADDGPPPGDPRDIALFLLSSGTTGPPKAIPRSHEALGHVIRCASAVSGLSAESVYLALMPVEHSFVFGHPGILGTLAAGGTVVFADPGDPGQAFGLVERERVTHCALVPALAGQWSVAPEAAAHDMSSLRVLQVGGARLDPVTADRIQTRLGCRVQQVYGMSEGLLNFTRLDDPDAVVRETQGRPSSPGDELLVIGDDGEPTREGVGELITRGPSVITGYWADPAANERAFTPDGFYRTGDLVRLHPSGNYVVSGRIKDVINRGGEKIAADELEDLVRDHPGVRDAAAVAMPHRMYGEAVCLYVVPTDGQRPGLPVIRRYLTRRGLSPFKLPARVELLDALPMKGVGKVDKAALREEIARRVEAERAERADTPGMVSRALTHRADQMTDEPAGTETSGRCKARRERS
ncbi:AMP-binding protein [Streptomyces sp. NA02950]|nr:AMP-binding protein [Streptomyces sp. NA02950]